MVEEATVDCYGAAEEVMGLFTKIEEELRTPFGTQILGVEVTVEHVRLNERDDIVAICRRGRHRQVISLFDLPLPSPPPAGAEWIQAYRHWAGP